MSPPASRPGRDAAPDRPLDVFIHIPKTAGTSVNRGLALHHARASALGSRLAAMPGADRLWSGSNANQALSLTTARGCSHVQRFWRHDRIRDAILRRSDWVSGHLPYAAVKPVVRRRIGREARFFTLLRDPVDQIASHFGWWIEIRERGLPGYLTYPRRLRALSVRVRGIDARDPRQVVAVLEEHRPLFLNIQARYLLGPGLDWPQNRIRRRLARFACVSPGDAGLLVAAMTGSANDVAEPRNVSRGSFDRAVFRTPELSAFLRAHHALDLRLWRVAGGATPPP